MQRTTLAILILAATLGPAAGQTTDLLNQQRGVLTKPMPDFGAAAREQSRQSQQEFRFNQSRQTDLLQRRIQGNSLRATDSARQQLGRRPAPFTN